MSQSTLDDDLFDEAASEVRADVEANLEKARAALPDSHDVWDVDADNMLGALNALRSALDVGDADEHLRDAKKWYTMGERADAFEDGDDLAAEIEAVEGIFSTIRDAREQVSDLASTLPQLRSTLDDASEEAEADGGEEDDVTDEEVPAEDEDGDDGTD